MTSEDSVTLDDRGVVGKVVDDRGVVGKVVVW